MLSLLGFQIFLPHEMEFLTIPWVAFLLNIFSWAALIALFNFTLLRGLRFLIRQTESDLGDIVFAILHHPLIALLFLYGVFSSFHLLNLPYVAGEFFLQIVYTAVVLIITHICGRTIKDIFVYYGEKWAARTESKVDDVLIPVVNLFGPVVLVLGAALVILPLWGINVTSVLVGAGVVGLVLGLALQDTLSNIFSGLSLLVEAPFRTGDLVTLPDGRISKIQRIGMRSTQLYSITEHATVYVPNKIFSSTTLTNFTKPTVDQKYILEVSIAGNKDLAAVNEKLRRIAAAHPAVLVSDMDMKLPLLREQIAVLHRQAKTLGRNHPAYKKNVDEIQRNENCIPRLELEGRLNHQLAVLQEAIRNLIRGIKAREMRGLDEEERQEIFCNFISPVEHEIESVTSLAKSWSETPDPWLDDGDHWDLHELWEMRNNQLINEWGKVKKSIYRPDDRYEMRLDDITARILDWIQLEYKIIPSYWKDPVVVLKQFDGSTAQVCLSFYVDNIRLEHDERANRVRSEIGNQVRDCLLEMRVWD
jgi:MscS family membrane protein